MKKLIVTIMTLVLLLAVALPVSAQKQPNNQPIAPLTDASDKTEAEIDKHLKKMGFTDSELATITIELKKDIAANGGLKIKASKLNPTRIDVDENGKETVIAPTEPGTITTKDYTNGDFNMFGYAIKNSAPNSYENSYTVYMQYRWAKPPVNCYTDTIAMAWQSSATPYGDPYSIHNWRSDPYLYQYTNDIQKKLIEGDSWEVDVISAGVNEQQDGFAKQEIRVAKSYEGQTGAVALGYNHRYLPGVAIAVLKYFNIDFEGLSQSEWYDRFNFTY